MNRNDATNRGLVTVVQVFDALGGTGDAATTIEIPIQWQYLFIYMSLYALIFGKLDQYAIMQDCIGLTTMFLPINMFEIKNYFWRIDCMCA